MLPKRVVVVGTGTMGPGIAEVFALHGVETVLCGRTRDSVACGLRRARGAGRSLERLGLVGRGAVARGARRLSGATDLEEAAAAADFIVESIPENLERKRECFARLGCCARPGAILVSNTSGLRITEIASAACRPGRVAGMHWWNPPHLVPLVEVVLGRETGPATAKRVAQVARALGKLPVLVRKDVPGFIANRLQYALLREAIRLVEQGIATPADVDLALRAGPGLRSAVLGPLETMDFIGLDVVADIMDYLLPALGTARGAPSLLRRLVRSGRLGVKSGRGFYSYSGGISGRLAARRNARLATLLHAGFGR